MRTREINSEKKNICLVTSKDVKVYDEISYLNEHFIAVNEWELCFS